MKNLKKYRTKVNFRAGFSALLLLFVFSCSSVKKVAKVSATGNAGPVKLSQFCDSAQDFKSLYFNQANIQIHAGEENYVAKITIYYIPDSVIFVTAANSGFEVIRAGIWKDSTVFINRSEKEVYKIDTYNSNAPPPVDFSDLELLINKNKWCNLQELKNEKGKYILDRSVQDIKKVIKRNESDLGVTEFEFFQKKTGEYAVGERNENGILFVFSNYIVKDLELSVEIGGWLPDKVIDVNMDFNPLRYDIYKL